MEEGVRAPAIPVYLQILCALNFLGHGCYQFATGTTCHFLMSQLCESLHIKSTIGSIDCSHIAIISPPRDHPTYPAGPYYNRKGYYSINVQLIVNAEENILNVNARYPGSVHDSAVWQMSTINTYLRRNHLQGNLYYHLIGDEGYPLTPWLLTQYAGNVLNNTPQGRYNSHLRRARNSVQKVNGILKERFRCILKHRTLNYDPIKSGKIINTYVVLHNMALHFNVAPPDDDLRILEDMDNDDRRPLEEQELGIFF
nr:unnamed protein product [Callosobruchus analis]